VLGVWTRRMVVSEDACVWMDSGFAEVGAKIP